MRRIHVLALAAIARCGFYGCRHLAIVAILSLLLFLAMTGAARVNADSEVPQTVKELPQATSASTYEENNSIFKYDDSWQQRSDQRAAGGGFRVAGKSFATVRFTVEGDSFTLIRRIG